MYYFGTIFFEPDNILASVVFWIIMSLAISYFVEPYFLVSRVCICSFLNIYWSFKSPSQNVMNWHHIFWYSALVSEVFSIIIDHLSGWSFEWSFIWKRHSTYFVEPYFLVSCVCIWVDPRNREVKTYQKRQLFFRICTFCGPSLKRSFSALRRSWELCFGYVSGLVGGRGFWGKCWDFSWDSWRFWKFAQNEKNILRNSISRFSVTVWGCD